jgi:hypothetical protein
MVAFDKEIARFVGTRNFDISTAMRDVECIVGNLESRDSRTFFITICVIRPYIVFTIDSGCESTTVNVSAGRNISMQERFKETLFCIIIGNGDVLNGNITLQLV